jgi:hypothetical protein
MHIEEHRMRETAKSDSWKTLPMPHTVAELDFPATFSEQEFAQIALGLIPEAMEDKWFMYLEATTLHLHRSWTGHCIYKVQFEQTGAIYTVRRATVNRDSDQYREDDNSYDAEMLNFLIRNFLLGDRVPFPMPSNLPKNAPKGLFQHHVSGSGFPETPTKRERKKE